MTSYFDWAARSPSIPASDFVDLPEAVVLEGEAAEDSIRRYYSQLERAPMELIGADPLPQARMDAALFLEQS